MQTRSHYWHRQGEPVGGLFLYSSERCRAVSCRTFGQPGQTVHHWGWPLWFWKESEQLRKAQGSHYLVSYTSTQPPTVPYFRRLKWKMQLYNPIWKNLTMFFQKPCFFFKYGTLYEFASHPLLRGCAHLYFAPILVYVLKWAQKPCYSSNTIPYFCGMLSTASVYL